MFPFKLTESVVTTGKDQNMLLVGLTSDAVAVSAAVSLVGRRSAWIWLICNTSLCVRTLIQNPGSDQMIGSFRPPPLGTPNNALKTETLQGLRLLRSMKANSRVDTERSPDIWDFSAKCSKRKSFSQKFTTSFLP